MKKFVIIMLSITGACLIIAITLTAVNQGNNPVWPQSNWETVIEGRSGEVDQTQSASLDGVTSVSVRASSDSIRLHHGDTDEVKVHFHGTISSSRRNAPVPTLRMTQSGQSVSFWLESPRIIGVLFYNRNTVMDVYLPASYAGAVKLDTSSGSIDVEGFVFDKLSCDASSGSVKVKDTGADTVYIDTSSGGIEIEGISTGQLTAGATSGSINGGNITASDISLDTSSGSIRLSDVQGNIGAHSSSGTIRIEDVAGADTVRAEASSGSIHMTFTDMGSDYRFDTSSGSVSLGFPQDAEFAIKFDTSSGSFHSDFPITMTKTERDHVEGYVVSDGNRVSVDTSSGGCRINIR